MNRKGFSLIELMIAVAIIAILLSIGTITFSDWVKRNKVETQFKQMFADLMTARAQALYKKSSTVNARGRSVIITNSVFSLYSTTNTGVSPVQTITLKVPVTPANTRVDFDQSGVALLNSDESVTEAYVCVQSNNTNAVINSLIISKTRIQMGRLTGTGCSSANVTSQ
jgi:prepilin-type N-terminal cleavage/methylation domain-containing protein